jgi:hypothetical protein
VGQPQPLSLYTPERRPRARRLTLPDAAEIRSRYRAGELQVVLAEEFGVTQPQVSRIVRGLRWVAE